MLQHRYRRGFFKKKKKLDIEDLGQPIDGYQLL